MTFVQNSFLIATAAVAIPIVVHLLNRRQVRRVELGTMRFLQDVIQDGSRQRRLRRWLLLATRSLVMLLLAFLFARPYLVENVSGRDGKRNRMILIDRSASMGMKGSSGRIMDDAVSAANDAATDAGEGASIQYAWFDRHVQPVSQTSAALQAPRTPMGSTDYGAAIRWAKSMADASPGDAVDVVLITDLQQNGLRSRLTELATETFPADVPVQIVDVGREAMNNLTIANLNVEADQISPGHPVKIDVTLFNYGSLPFEDITARIVAFDGTKSVRLRKSVNIGAGEVQETAFDLGTLNPGMWQITATVDVDDDLVADNQRLTAIEVASPAKVIVLDSTDPDAAESSSSYYFNTALAQDGRNWNGENSSSDDESNQSASAARFAPQVIDPHQQGIPKLSAADVPLTVISDASTIRPELVASLSDYVKNGGHLLAFAGSLNPESRNAWKQSALSPGTFQPSLSSGAMPFRMVEIDANSQMMLPFSDPQHADLSRLAFRKVLPVQPNATTKVFAWFDDQRPAITQHSVGKGQVIWFLSSMDSEWSNWTASPLYLPLVQQMAAELLNLNGEGRIRRRNVGDDDHRNLLTSLPANPWTTAKASPLAVASPATEKQPTDSALPAFQSPGFRSTKDGLYVVNSEARESDPTRLDAEALSRHFGLTAAVTSQTDEVRPARTEKKVEYWPWLAAALFVLMFAEFCLANRTTA